MTRLRLALVSRRFWPMAGGVETATSDLARELRRQGHQVQIATSQLETRQPKELFHHETPVTRLTHPGTGLWGRLRYMYALMHWLDRRRNELDGVIVSNLRYDAWCAVRTFAGTNVPVILRAAGAGPGGDVAWQKSAWWGGSIVRSCRTADAIVADDAAGAAELIAADYPASRVHVIPPAVQPQPERTDADRRAARNALRPANPDLTLDDRAAVVVYLGPLAKHKELPLLIRAWQSIAEHRPLARLWLIGDGPARDELWELISDLDLKYRVCMPGTFDDIEEILAVADVVVSVSSETGLSASLLEAMAAGVPVVATDHAVHREAIGEAGLLVPAGDKTALIAAVEKLLDDPTWRAECGAAGRRIAESRYTLAEQATAFVRLIEEVRANRAATTERISPAAG